jgi:manganese/zinc/iron transport system permease protein
MNQTIHNFLQVDFMPLAAGLLAAITCGLLGNFLILRKLSLMGDAISHSVLPGLIAAFLITASRGPLPMFLGAAVSGVATVLLVELVKRIGRVESGAAMGVVFSVLFALGVLLIEQGPARGIDLDPQCVLYGDLTTLFWFAPNSWSELFTWHTLSQTPRQVATLFIMAIAAAGFITLLFKELRIAAFDAELATTQGFHAGFLHFLLMVFVAAATVASFEAVGSILVVAMLICPAATARLLTDRLHSQILWSVIIAAIGGIGGYLAANALPAALNRAWSLNAAGMMSVVAGGLLVLSILFAPRHGVIAKAVRLRRLSGAVSMEDILAALFRAREASHAQPTVPQLAAQLSGRDVERGLALAESRGLILRGDHVILTNAGEVAARDLIRRHRLWESYLVTEAGLAPDHVHPTAERLEHLPVRPEADSGAPATDPHGKRIPSPADS